MGINAKVDFHLILNPFLSEVEPRIVRLAQGLWADFGENCNSATIMDSPFPVPTAAVNAAPSFVSNCAFSLG